jgi:hypothetical protein
MTGPSKVVIPACPESAVFVMRRKKKDSWKAGMTALRYLGLLHMHQIRILKGESNL